MNNKDTRASEKWQEWNREAMAGDGLAEDQIHDLIMDLKTVETKNADLREKLETGQDFRHHLRHLRRHAMIPEELRAHCLQQINLVPGMEKTARIGLRMRGHWGKRETKRIWPGGPVGEIVAEISENEVMVLFNANEVLKALDKRKDTP